MFKLDYKKISSEDIQELIDEQFDKFIETSKNISELPFFILLELDILDKKMQKY